MNTEKCYRWWLKCVDKYSTSKIFVIVLIASNNFYPKNFSIFFVNFTIEDSPLHFFDTSPDFTGSI